MVYERRADEAFESASVIKLLILYALYAVYENDLATLDAPHGIAPENRVGGTGLFHLLPSLTPSLADLAVAMIAISDNAATNELIDEVGVDAINSTATRLDMTNTRLGRKMMTLEGTGLDTIGGVPEGEPANTTSPHDCARFFADLLDERTLTSVAYERMRVPFAEQKQTTMFPRYFPYDTAIEHKTGWVPSAALDTGFLPEATDSGFLVYAVFVDHLDHGADGADTIAEIGQALNAWLADHDA